MDLTGDNDSGEVQLHELCAVCHAADGSGIDEAPSLQPLHHRDKQLLTWSLDGKDEDMPAFGSELTGQATADLLALVKELE